ncbi:MAG: rhodanese-like domain-containing protein [Paracoccaceae bacterium]|tara:strand:- start:29 stop:418 length:390 start_codon:yes stop_codon:yes gene_type:complete
MKHKTLKDLLNEANSSIQTIDSEKAVELLGKDNFVFIDLRDKLELKKTGKIPGSISCPRGMLEFFIDNKSPYHKEIFSQNKNFIFYCASGLRSALGTQTAKNMGVDKVAHISGGFTSWIKNGGEVEKIE